MHIFGLVLFFAFIYGIFFPFDIVLASICLNSDLMVSGIFLFYICEFWSCYLIFWSWFGDFCLVSLVFFDVSSLIWSCLSLTLIIFWLLLLLDHWEFWPEFSSFSSSSSSFSSFPSSLHKKKEKKKERKWLAICLVGVVSVLCFDFADNVGVL